MRAPSKLRSRALLLATVSVCAYVAVRSSSGEVSSVETLLHRAVERPILWLDRAVATITEPVREVFRREGLHQRIAQLQERIANLELENASLVDAEVENGRLAGLLGLRDRDRLQARAARVIDADPVGPLRSIRSRPAMPDSRRLQVLPPFLSSPCCPSSSVGSIALARGRVIAFGPSHSRCT